MTMKKHLNPSEAARETLIVLASRKLAPTPENYSKVFREIDGSSDSALRTPDTPQLEPAWADLIQDLLRQLETPHKGITITRKKEGLETVLNRFSKACCAHGHPHPRRHSTHRRHRPISRRQPLPSRRPIHPKSKAATAPKRIRN